jgi:hypothetical protein
MDRIARYSGLKNQSYRITKHVRETSMLSPKDRKLSKLSNDLSQCANYLIFHDYYTVDQLRLVKAVTCKKSLLCPFCAARRAAKQLEKNLPRLKQVMALKPALKPVMITLTVKNGESLSERYLHLKQAYARLQQRRRNALKGQEWTEFARVAGGIHSYEFTRSAEGWHPHIHIVALLDSYIDQKALSAEWLEITGDSFIVDVRRIQPGEHGLASGMLEVFKYALKFQDLEVADTFHAYTVLNKRRLIGCFGVLRGVEEPDNLLDDPLDGLPFHEYSYVFNFASGAYDLEKTRYHLTADENPLSDRQRPAPHWTPLPPD